ncbi:MICOS complex subunit MIC27 isoform X1 [Hippocampus zosterae]|uniref:MICOS complex subunit MIC27 isoform X1 n=1 Tax=Hippocampus zosterae TaxID=109293 RepID=UPI00223D805B|nr:MICOS complex subunit MIC27 isoform X1 [Hippocampus zosterae]
MAAKVAMVAVPAMLGIASIRVYTISEMSTEGLITREKLNIYTPEPKSAQVQVVPDQPGLIESGLASAREHLQPLVHTVKGACISVKRGSVNLYHAGEDVYYCLKDPPPGFLPRVGTITMAGLLGMFVARKGSRLKRIVVPLGLMSAGASVCYPAQAVAVFKVTGKKMYAAGQWSRTTVSSLLTSKPPEPDAARQPQATPVPPPEATVVDEPHPSEPGTVPSFAISDTEVRSAECGPDADNLIIAIATEEASVKLTEISAEQAAAEIHSESLDRIESEALQATKEAQEGAVAISNDAIASSEAISPASDGTPAETLPAEPTQSSEPETKESAQVESAPADVPASTADLPPIKTSNETAGGAGFTPDPALLDFGQSSPEDEDLYSTR